MNAQIIRLPQNETSALPTPVQDALGDVLNDPTINQIYGGKNGKLSKQQAGLVAAVVAKMLERLIGYINKVRVEERVFVGGILKLYRTPVFRVDTAGAAEKKSGEAGAAKKFGSEGLFTWGNLIGGTAVVIVALSFYYTKLTKNWEDAAKQAEASVVQLTSKLASEQKANETLEFELGKAQARAEASEKAFHSVTANTADTQKAMMNMIADFSEKRGELAKQLAASSGEKKFQSLYESAQKDLAKLRKENANLLERAVKAEEQLKSQGR